MVEEEPKKPVEPPHIRYSQLEALSLDLEHERADLRVSLDTAIRDELTARLELDRIARSFMQGFGRPQTPDELLKAHAASEAETRRKIAAGELPGRRHSPVGPSVLDQYAAAQRGGRAGFAGRGYTRGASPVSKRTMPFPRTAQAAGQPGGARLQKLPSER